MLPLDESWDPSTVSYKIIDSGDFPLVNFAALWVDDTGKRLYSWGGEDPYLNDEAEDKDLWVFEPNDEGGGKWSIQDPGNSDVFDDITRPVKAGYATCGSTGFSLGGYYSEYTDPDTDVSDTSLSTLQSFDMETKKWSRDSVDDVFNYPSGASYAGRAVCGAPGDSDPFLFSLGGLSLGDRGDDIESVKILNPTFYDPKSKKCHWQCTRGDGPADPSRFCAVGVRGPDETYEM